VKNIRTIYDSSLFLASGGDDIYEVAAREGGLCIDGGAAAGFVTRKLANGGCRVLAFEPFPGNIPHFNATVGSNPRVTLFQKALADFNGKGRFFVRAVVDGSGSGAGRFPGYSSEGYLISGEVPQKSTDKQLFDVDVVRLQDVVNEDVTLLKLDLQRGEYNALLGLGNGIERVKYCYVEFLLDWRVVEWFFERDFVVFDTEYVGIPKVPMEQAKRVFDEPGTLNLSNGYQAAKGRLRGVPRDLDSYREFVERAKGACFHYLWSDLIAVNPRHLGRFLQLAVEAKGTLSGARDVK
jgi:FkbM family methyltransferase